MVYLYHYTDAKGAKGILEAKKIKGSTRETRDAAFGNGVYLTSIAPKEGKKKIIKNNYDDAIDGSSIPMNRAQCYFRFDSNQLKGVKKMSGTDRDVWLYENDILLNSVSYEFGMTDEAQDLITLYDSSGSVSSIALT